MSRRLVPCRACLRHVGAAEPACPFCGAARAVDLRAAERVPPRLRRAATMAFATALVGCELEKGPASPTEGAPGASNAATSATSAPSAPSATPAGSPAGSPTYDPGAPKKPYGAPPVDGLLV